MCEICGQYFCYPSCPSFMGVSAELGNKLFRCAACGENVYEADDYKIDKGRAYCSVCAREVENRNGAKDS